MIQNPRETTWSDEKSKGCRLNNTNGNYHQLIEIHKSHYEPIVVLECLHEPIEGHECLHEWIENRWNCNWQVEYTDLSWAGHAAEGYHVHKQFSPIIAQSHSSLNQTMVLLRPWMYRVNCPQSRKSRQWDPPWVDPDDRPQNWNMPFFLKWMPWLCLQLLWTRRKYIAFLAIPFKHIRQIRLAARERKKGPRKKRKHRT